MHAVVRILSVLLIAGTWAGWEVLERQNAPVTSPAPFSATIAPTTDVEALIFTAADIYGVDRALARAVLTQESGGDAMATSAVGAAGLMQVMPGTAAGIAQELGVLSYDLYDPQTNATFGMYYLSEKIKRYGVPFGLAAYNWGPSAVDGLLSRHPGMDWAAMVAAYGGEIPEETRGYVASILAQMEETQVAYTPRVSSSGAVRARVIQLALAQVGKGYVLGAAGPDTFDCSGLVHWVYAQQGIETGRDTFAQLAQLPPIDANQIQAGDMIYFQFSWDQHTGILADVNGDGRWDMINAGTPQIGVVVTDNVFGDPFWTNAIIGYRRAL